MTGEEKHPDRVNVLRKHERLGWATRLGVTQSVLREAVRAVGPELNDVKDWLVNRIREA